MSAFAVFHKQLGDLVLLEPALRKIADHHGQPVRLLTRSGHAPLVGLMECARYQSEPAWPPARALYAFDPLSKTAVRAAFAPAWNKQCLLPERREARPFLRFIFRRVHIPELGREYIAEYFWKHAPVPSTTGFSPPRLVAPPAAWKPAWAPGRPFALVNPTAGWRKKNWTPAGWAAVARALHARSLTVVVTSGGADWQRAEAAALAEAAPEAGILLPGSTALTEFLWLCGNARVVATVDGSASHLAAAFGVPSLTLFGPTEMSHWHRGSPISAALQAPPGPDGKYRLRHLPADEAVSAIETLLAG